MSEKRHIPFSMKRMTEEEMRTQLDQIYDRMDQRRSVRHFSRDPVPIGLLERAIQIAGTAPSGAHKQPWTFCLVTDSNLRKRIRLAAEAEEYTSYNGRMSERWLADLEPIGTDHTKPFIEDAPALIVVFRKVYEIDKDSGKRHSNYYVQESCGIAVGFLLAALHEVGLAALTHTPSPMGFLCELLNRPENERAFLNIPVGWPANDATVPNLLRKPLNEIMFHYGGHGGEDNL